MQPASIKQNAAFAYIVLYATLYISPKPYFDLAKELCNVYAIITLHEVKDTCAAKYFYHMLQLHEQIKVLVYTNVTSVLYTFVNSRQNNVNHWTFI